MSALKYKVTYTPVGDSYVRLPDGIRVQKAETIEALKGWGAAQPDGLWLVMDQEQQTMLRLQILVHYLGRSLTKTESAKWGVPYSGLDS